MVTQQRPLYNKKKKGGGFFSVNPVIYDFSNKSERDLAALNIPHGIQYTAECYFVCHPPNSPHHGQNVNIEQAIEFLSASQCFFMSCGNLAYSQNEEETKQWQL